MRQMGIQVTLRSQDLGRQGNWHLVSAAGTGRPQIESRLPGLDTTIHSIFPVPAAGTRRRPDQVPAAGTGYRTIIYFRHGSIYFVCRHERPSTVDRHKIILYHALFNHEMESNNFTEMGSSAVPSNVFASLWRQYLLTVRLLLNIV